MFTSLCSEGNGHGLTSCGGTNGKKKQGETEGGALMDRYEFELRKSHQEFLEYMRKVTEGKVGK